VTEYERKTENDGGEWDKGGQRITAIEDEEAYKNDTW